MRASYTIALVAGLLAVTAVTAAATEWTPRAWARDSTVELRTRAAGEEAHWFPVWLVVIDDQLYVRLGPRAAGRIEGNTTKPIVGVRIAGRQFDRVRAEPAPDMVARVAEVMAAKYWFDLIVHHFDHPLTMRLVPEPE